MRTLIMAIVQIFEGLFEWFIAIRERCRGRAPGPQR